MKFRQLLRLCTFGCGMLLVAAMSLRASAATSPIPLAVKTSADADKNPLVADYVKTQVAALSDVAQRHDVREALIDQVNAIGGQALSKEFLDEYAKQLNTQFMPAANNPD